MQFGESIKVYGMNNLKEKKPAITVIVTTYNLENYIGKFLNNLYEQDFQNFNILCVDDSSTDKTLQIIKGWKKKFGIRLKIIESEINTGMPAKARNIALNSGLIDGEYVLFMDGDDTIEPNMLSRMYETVSKDSIKADVCICAYDRVDIDTGKRLGVEMQGFPDEYIISNSDDTIAFINTSPWNKLWRYEVIKDLRYSEFKVGEEVSFNFRGYLNSKSIRFIDDVLIHYMVHSDSVISNTDEETIWNFADDLRNLRNEVNAEYESIVELMIFLHIGLSMALRAGSNKDIDLKKYLKQIEAYFGSMSWFKYNIYFKFDSLKYHGTKGIMIWIAFIMYKTKMFAIALCFYNILGFNIKF